MVRKGFSRAHVSRGWGGLVLSEAVLVPTPQTAKTCLRASMHCLNPCREKACLRVVVLLWVKDGETRPPLRAKLAGKSGSRGLFWGKRPWAVGKKNERLVPRDVSDIQMTQEPDADAQTRRRWHGIGASRMLRQMNSKLSPSTCVERHRMNLCISEIASSGLAPGIFITSVPNPQQRPMCALAPHTLTGFLYLSSLTMLHLLLSKPTSNNCGPSWPQPHIQTAATLDGRPGAIADHLLININQTTGN